MYIAFNVLIVLIAASPVLGLIGGAASPLVLMALVGCGCLALASGARQAEASHLVRTTTGFTWLFLLVPLIVVIQLVPLPISWSHPIWASSAEVIDRGFGHITIDIGRTLDAFIWSMTAIAATVMAMAVARDRRRAELILLAAGAVVTLPPLMSLVHQLTPTIASTAVARETAMWFAAFGTVINVSALLLVTERRQTRQHEATQYLPVGLGCALALAINVIGLYRLAEASQWVAGAFGLAVIVLVLIIRRLALSRWAAIALCFTALFGVVIVATWLSNQNTTATGLLRFVPSPPAGNTVGRLMADGRWLGSGAGTFDLLARIYQESNEITDIEAPTTAIEIAAETGWFGMSVFALIGLVLFTTLFIGALTRGRDWFFAGVAAANLAIALSGSFILPNLFQPAIVITLSVLTGLGLSQSFSQTNRL